MDVNVVMRGGIDPALHWLAQFGLRPTEQARIVLAAIAMQESECQFRRQFGRGPARGFWQFEPNGVLGVLRHHASSAIAEAACAELGVAANVAAIHAAIEFNDELAAIFARLLLFTDPAVLEERSEPMYRMYLRTWRPGRPAPERWGRSWAAARRAQYVTQRENRRVIATVGS